MPKFTQFSTRSHRFALPDYVPYLISEYRKILRGFRKCHGDVSSAEQENRGEILTIKHDLNRGDDSRIDTEEEWVKTDVKRVTKRKKLLVHDQVSWSCNGCTITNRASHFIQKNVEFRPPCTTIVPWSCRGARSCTLEVKTR
ncbi:hypothetical protein ACS0TY_007818 [Phlomoides rotata]